MQDLRYLAYLLEAVAAVSGLYYYRKNIADKAAGFFAYFLLLTFLIETIGWIPTIIFRWEDLHFLKDSFWYRNYWLHNPFLIFTFLVYGYYLKTQLIKQKAKQIVKMALMSYFIICSVYLIFSGVFFESFSAVSYVGGSLMLLAIIFYYYLEILQSQKIFYFQKDPGFYISVVAFIYYLSCTPVFIYSKYYNILSPGFIKLNTWVIVGMNIFMYGSYSIAFLLLANKKKSSPNNFKNAI